MKFAPGDVIDDRYQLRQKLGAGGFGEVWLAEQPEPGRLVAIKFLGKTVDRKSQVRFRRETHALGRIAQRHVVEFFGAGYTDDGVAYIVTEYVQGQSLRPWAAGRSVDEIIEVTRQIASALDAAHREGTIHRDLKPANVLVTVGPGGGPHVKVLDFGLARLTGRTPHDVTKTGEVIGTPGYMSPEQLRGRRDIATPTDLYCLGVILWELLEERRIFAADTALGISMMHLMESPPPITRDVSPELEQLTMRLLLKDPGQRPGIAQVLRVLDTAGRTAEQRSGMARESERATKRRALGELPIIAALVTASLAVAAVFLFVRSPDDVPPNAPSGGVVSPALHSSPSPARVAPPTEPAVDLGDRDFGLAPGTPGCGKSVSSVGEEHTIRDGLSRTVVYVPETYDPEVPQRLIVLLHRGAQEPREMLAEANMESIADENQLLLAAPEGKRLEPFEGGAIMKNAWPRAVDRVLGGGYVEQLPSRLWHLMERFCVDLKRVYLVGHDVGGTAALHLLEHTEVFAAVATTAHRRKLADPHPIPLARVPYLSLAPSGSPRLPDNGREGSCNSSEYVTIEEQIDTVRRAHGCRGDGRPWPTADGATCRTWDCDVPYVSCRVDGGRLWNDYRGYTECEGEEPEYDYPGGIWRFFRQVENDEL